MHRTYQFIHWRTKGHVVNTIEERWEKYSKHIIGTPSQLRQVKLGFFAGAAALVSIEWELFDETMSDELASAVMDNVTQEIVMFEVKYGVAPQLPQDLIESIVVEGVDTPVLLN